MAVPALVDLGVMTKDGKVVKIAALPEFYLHYEDIMIPWDARVLNRDKKFTR